VDKYGENRENRGNNTEKWAKSGEYQNYEK